MRKVYTPEIKIITIEDPIEYHLQGISQTQVNKAKDYTFLNGLRNALLSKTRTLSWSEKFAMEKPRKWP